MKAILLVLTSLSFASFLWSVIGVFRRDSDRNHAKYTFLRVLTVLTWAACLGAFRRESSELAYLIGSLTQTIVLVIFWLHVRIVKSEGFSVVYSTDIPAKIVRKGLYKWVRHPFYMVYLISYFSTAFVFTDPLVFCLSGAMAWIYFDAAKMEEIKFHSSHHATEFLNYQQVTWMFLPKFKFEKQEPRHSNSSPHKSDKVSDSLKN